MNWQQVINEIINSGILNVLKQENKSCYTFGVGEVSVNVRYFKNVCEDWSKFQLCFLMNCTHYVFVINDNGIRVAEAGCDEDVYLDDMINYVPQMQELLHIIRVCADDKKVWKGKIRDLDSFYESDAVEELGGEYSKYLNTFKVGDREYAQILDKDFISIPALNINIHDGLCVDRETDDVEYSFYYIKEDNKFSFVDYYIEQGSALEVVLHNYSGLLMEEILDLDVEIYRYKGEKKKCTI